MQQLITIRKGSLLSVKVQNADDTVTVMTEDEQKKNKYSADETLIVQISTVDFELGQYYVVTESAKGDLLDIQPFKVIGLFEKESRKDTLKQQIDLLDKVISAKLSESEGVLQQLSINNKTLVYSSLSELTLLVDSLRKQLNAEITKEQRKNGEAPFKQIKLVLNRG
nr:MAG TPA: hypothetical protein [Caudoviricetes sp.]